MLLSFVKNSLLNNIKSSLKRRSLRMKIHLAEVENLLNLSEKMDEEGRTEEAAVLHLAAQKLVQAAKEDEEEEEAATAGLSGKQKKALKALKTCAERVTKVFGNRIPRNCKAVDSHCEDILELLKSMDLD
jgi:hypothetical protein